MKRKYIKFRAFYLIWMRMHGLKPAEVHYRICDWLEKFFFTETVRNGVLKVWRGAAKSTILSVFQAYIIRHDPAHQLILDRSADDPTANKLSSATLDVLQRHPLCKGIIKDKRPGIERFWAVENKDKRNASVTACGILSNPTSSRATFIANDDVEVPKNIETIEKREKLRNKLNEEVHIMVPGGKVLYVGTDHTHNSIYDEKINMGFESLVIPLFRHSVRIEADGKKATYEFDFPVRDKSDFYVMTGIHKSAKMYEPHEYDLNGGTITFNEIPSEGTSIDLCAHNEWPERFDRAEVKFKREGCRTLNAWDSQYMLKARPIHEIRLNPERMVIYEDDPELRFANGAVAMSLNNVQLTGARACWDCSLGKPDSDDSAFSVMFQDEIGHLYWQVLDVLQGEVYEQCDHLIKWVVKYQLPSVTIKTKGLGGFLPAILKKKFKENGITCAVVEQNESTNKNTRILVAYEAPLSGQFLHVHRAVYEVVNDQMRDWIPSKTNQPDDLLDAGEGCISNLPVKIGKVVKITAPQRKFHDWRATHGTYEVKVESGR